MFEPGGKTYLKRVAIGFKLIPVEFWLRPQHRCWSKQIFGNAMIFVQIFPNLSEKLLCNFCLQIFSHSAPPPSSVNAVDDGSLPQVYAKMPSRAPALIKFSLHLWSTHLHVSFASVENSVMFVSKKGFKETAATVFIKKSRQIFRQSWQSTFQ